jgi:hypothetical protein
MEFLNRRGNKADIKSGGNMVFGCYKDGSLVFYASTKIKPEKLKELGISSVVLFASFPETNSIVLSLFYGELIRKKRDSINRMLRHENHN